MYCLPFMHLECDMHNIWFTDLYYYWKKNASY